GAPHRLGMLGERIAACHLEGLGYNVIERNFRLGHREIDLIVRRGDLIAFVEVKTRKGAGYGHPLEAITARKRREVERVARHWLQRYGRRGLHYRFDAVAVVFGESTSPDIEHLPGAWRLGE
ncbi:MAG TPA: YraN family protein, partial [Gemmatimonadota bacterium]|nr:YraN family protein [Gemmatimonadota bacterium]